MIRTLSAILVFLALTTSAFSRRAPSPRSLTSGITLIGKGLVSGSALDKSGLTGDICQQGVPVNCVPKAIFGGFGSDLTYTGHDNVYIAAPDRGPFDGLTDVPYLNRVHFLHITTDLGTPFPNIHTVLLDTRFLKNEQGQTFVGAAGDFDLRLDPEGIRVGANGTFYISDEYGPYVFEFDRQGNLLRRLSVPDKFLINSPSASVNRELRDNTSGRQANRGMEGLAISPDGSTLFGIMQSALIQDDGLAKPFPTPDTDANPPGRLGLNNRILKMNLLTGETHEYVYVLDAINRGQGVSDILAINDHEFLVIERDNRSNLQTPPQAPTRKNIYRIDLTGATEVSGNNHLPATPFPGAVSKFPFINLLDPDLNLIPTIAEKIEGLAWGPDLPDGRHVLYVISDNDLTPGLATQIYAFAINSELLNFEAQLLPGPFYPPGQVKKLLAGN